MATNDQLRNNILQLINQDLYCGGQLF